MNSNIAFRVENIGKQYRIGGVQAPYGTLRETIVDAVKKPMQRLRNFSKSHSGKNHIWALKDVSFEMKRGEVLGIIGPNGAGKSTLLKILSRITSPTTGRIELYGRVGSLLEVGTGFHPELTGRENIFLNGAILGMGRNEIKRKLDEIVAFAELEKILDTPVKRDSSGMFVGLAFAVAAQLEPDILIIDEVLAVGDVAFQKKWLAKVGDVASGGRTVLFVSHNMPAIKRLCGEAIVLEKGRMILRAPSDEAVEDYLDVTTDHSGERIWNTLENADPTSDFIMLALRVKNEKGIITEKILAHEPAIIEIEYLVRKPLRGLRVGVCLSSGDSQPVFASWDIDHLSRHGLVRKPGHYISRCHIPQNMLNTGRYFVGYNAGIVNVKSYENDTYALSFFADATQGFDAWGTRRWGVLMPLLDWEIEQVT